MTDVVADDRRALAAVAAQFFVNGAMLASFVARAPQIRDQIGVTVDRYGLLLTVATSVGLIGSAVAGRAVERVGTRRVLRAGAVVMVVSLPLIGTAGGPTAWLGAMMAYLLADLLVDIAMNLQGSWISARRHAPVMNRLHGVWSLGTLVGGLGAVAANAVGLSPSTHLVIVAVTMAILLASITRHLLAEDETDGHADAPRGATPRMGRRRRLPVVLVALAGMFATVAEAVPGDWAAFRLTDDLDAAAALGSAAFAALTVGMTTMRFAGDALQSRLGKRGLLQLSIGMAAVGLLLGALVEAPLVAIGGFAITGLGVATFMPTLYDDAARLPGRPGAGLGALTAATRVSFLATPVAVGALAATDLGVGDAIAVLTLPALLGLAVVGEWTHRLLRRRRSA